MTTNPQDNLGPWRDCGLLKNGCRSEGRCLGHSMTHIEDSELRKGIASEFDLLALHINQHKLYTPSAEMNGEINQRVNAAMALIKSYRGAWWVTTGLAQGGKKLLGPFATKDLALSVRSYMEIVEAPATYWVEEERKQ
jgi:hypothetical protein